VSERSLVRLASGVVAALSLVLPLLMRVPESLPSTAMGSALLLYLERVLAGFAILLFLLVFLYRSLVHGELPKTVSGLGPNGAILPARQRETFRRRLTTFGRPLAESSRSWRTEARISAWQARRIQYPGARTRGRRSRRGRSIFGAPVKPSIASSSTGSSSSNRSNGSRSLVALAEP
jgi:hypothetical protein